VQESRIRQLVLPKTTVMDLNIATALWFAAHADMVNDNDDEHDHSSDDAKQSRQSARHHPYRRRPSRIVLSGLGADELLGGYGRHRKAHERGGFDALRAELTMDLNRLWDRNLGRDDRIISDASREVRFPFLDATVVHLVQTQLPLSLIVDYSLPPGMGDKRLLRHVAQHVLGLTTAATAVKRAIQFGSRIAHVSDKRRFGSRRKASGEKES
jgi:asparagine synthetase B (glutamine-hydrolysing)